MTLGSNYRSETHFLGKICLPVLLKDVGVSQGVSNQTTLLRGTVRCSICGAWIIFWAWRQKHGPRKYTNADMMHTLQATQDRFHTLLRVTWKSQRNAGVSCSLSAAACGRFSVKRQEKVDPFCLGSLLLKTNGADWRSFSWTSAFLWHIISTSLLLSLSVSLPSVQ